MSGAGKMHLPFGLNNSLAMFQSMIYKMFLQVIVFLSTLSENNLILFCLCHSIIDYFCSNYSITDSLQVHIVVKT